MIKNKKGSIEIIFLFIIVTILIIITFCIYILYIQITTQVTPIKQDMFYIVQNAYFSLNKESLEYNDYKIDNYKLYNKVNDILISNHPEVTLEKIYYYSIENCVYVEITVIVKPIVFKDYIGNIKLKIKDTIKLKMMDVKK